MYPSPFRDDGYDIADYCAHPPPVRHPRRLPRVPRRPPTTAGLRVITELVLNHTSDQHPWFQEARCSPDSPKRDYYVWSDTDDRYRGVRIIFRDTEMSNWAWDPVSKAYYWHRFFSHQPDLNFDNPAVREEIWQVMRFWLDLGRRRVPGGRGALPRRARGDLLREPARDPRGRAGAAAEHGRGVPGADAPRRGQHVAGGRAALLRRRRRVPHGLPLPAHAADVHGAAAGGPEAPRRDHGAHAGRPRHLPVGPLPAQPRRADPRDGDGRRARLHVPGVRARPGGADQPGDPAPARAAPRRRPPPHRAHERPAALAAREPRPLLRRRDRDGGQRLPRRPQRRADPDAVDGGLERGPSRAPTPSGSTSPSSRTPSTATRR